MTLAITDELFSTPIFITPTTLYYISALLALNVSSHPDSSGDVGDVADENPEADAGEYREPYLGCLRIGERSRTKNVLA
jgi:hypothetical protein